MHFKSIVSTATDNIKTGLKDTHIHGLDSWMKTR